MSKHNVHPDHYKTGGRERQGKAFGQEASRKALAEQQARLAEYASRRDGLRQASAPASNRVTVARPVTPNRQTEHGSPRRLQSG